MFYRACARAYVHSALTVAPSSRAKVGMAGSSSSNSLPVDDIAKAVSEAVSSILSKLQNRNQEPETKLQQAVLDTSSADEFQFVAPSQKTEEEDDQTKVRQ